MELSSAEAYVAKLQKYLASVLSSDSAFYEKSKVRLRNLAQECQKSIQLIERILEENRLRSYGDSIDSIEHQDKTSEEFQEFQYLINATNHVSHECRVTAEQVGGLGFSDDTDLTDEFPESSETTTFPLGPDMDELPKWPKEASLEEDEPDDEGPSKAFHAANVGYEQRSIEGEESFEEPQEFIVGEFSAEKDPMMFNESSRITLTRSNPQYRASKLYTQVLQELAEGKHQFEITKELSVLIWNWFSTRFCKTTPSFFYSPKQFPRWIEDIILLYAYRLSEGTEDKLADEVRSWCGRTISEGQLSKYALPACVYWMDKSSEPEKFTLTAAVLYDLMLDLGLRELVNAPGQGCAIDENAVFDRIADVNPSALDKYRHYSVDPNILVECGILGSLEIGGDDR